MRALTLTILVAFTLLVGCEQAAKPMPAAAPDTLRRLTEGEVTGFINRAGGHSWLGIPFAAPPTGALRWRAPQPVSAWEDNRLALRAGSPCIQYGSALGGVGKPGSRQGSEDCLYLNVHAPRLSGEELGQSRLPVMVWIHGGGNTTGHGAFFDGSELATQREVLVVMINYRLGPFGWFRFPESADVDDLDRSGNFANLDILAALRWVQRNAAALGGDPANVTVFGESAGATNALALMVMPEAEGLFQRLIVQSLGFGFAELPAADSPHHPDRLLASMGVDTDQPGWLEAARALDPWTVYAAYGDINDEYNRVPSVFPDGVVVRQGDLRELLATEGLHHEVPVLIGTNRDENKIFMAFDERHSRKMFGLPMGLRDPEAYDREARYRSLLWKADGVDSIADALSSHGHAVFAYRWDWDEQGTAFGVMDVSRILGAAHGLEIPFVMGNFEVGPRSGLLFHEGNEAGRLALSRQMMQYWTQFARDGAPGGGQEPSLPLWPAWPGQGDARLMVLDTPSGGGLRATTDRVTRDAIVAELDTEPLEPVARCELFSAVFRRRHDPWADAAFRSLANGACSGSRLAHTD